MQRLGTPWLSKKTAAAPTSFVIARNKESWLIYCMHFITAFPCYKVYIGISISKTFAAAYRWQLNFAVFVNCFPTLIAFAWPINIWHSCTMSKEVVWKHTRCVQNNHCRLQYIVTNAMWSWEIVSENRSVGVLRVLIPQVQIDEATRDDDHFRRGALAPRARPTNNNATYLRIAITNIGDGQILQAASTRRK